MADLKKTKCTIVSIVHYLLYRQISSHPSWQHLLLVLMHCCQEIWRTKPCAAVWSPTQVENIVHIASFLVESIRPKGCAHFGGSGDCPHVSSLPFSMLWNHPLAHNMLYQFWSSSMFMMVTSLSLIWKPSALACMALPLPSGSHEWSLNCILDR